MSVDTLQANIRKLKNPTALGLDLQADLIPRPILDAAIKDQGRTPEALASAFMTYGEALLDRLREVIPAVKLNSAYFEAMGEAGFQTMRRPCCRAKEMGYFVVLETMRSDVEDAAALCAQTYLGSLSIDGEAVSLFDADAVCINAFTGSDGIRPYLPYCKDQDKSIFILAKTSNKSSREVQDLISGDRVIPTVMTDLAMRWSTDLFAQSGYSEIGVVVGATHPTVLRQMREIYDRLFFLVPGYGMQGGTAKDVQYAFDRFGHGAVIASSRSLLGAWKKTESDDYLASVYRAALKMREDISRYVTVI